ncbi:MAG: hypothetical protein Q4B01_09435, partial [Eubacteriales bacterium]|nr:hypothetical protein [Eubacteriales bacterium]
TEAPSETPAAETEAPETESEKETSAKKAEKEEETEELTEKAKVKKAKAEAEDYDVTVELKKTEYVWTGGAFSSYKIQEQLGAVSIDPKAGAPAPEGGTIEKTVSYENTSPDAGDHTIKVKVTFEIDDNGKKKTITKEIDKSITIKKRELSGFTQKDSVAYTGSDLLTTLKFKYIGGDEQEHEIGVGGENGLKLTVSGNKVVDAKEYKDVKVEMPDSMKKNYELTSDKVSFTVNKRVITVEWNGENNEVTTYDGNDHKQQASTKTAGVTVTTVVKDAEDNPVTESKNAGTYTASVVVKSGDVEVAEDDNNTIDGDLSHTYTINQRVINVVWEDETAEYEYDGEDHKQTASADGYTVEVTTTNLLDEPVTSSAKAGGYKAKAVIKDSTDSAVVEDENTVINNATKEYVVKKAGVEDIEWVDNGEVIYNGEGGRVLVPTAEWLAKYGLTESDLTITYGTADEERKNAGTYAATVTVDGENYKAETLPATLTVKQLPITITAENKEIFYGQNLDNSELNAEITDASNTMTAEAIRAELTENGSKALLSAEGQAAGTYTIAENENLNTANFEVTYAGGELTIKKLPITITPDKDQKRFYLQTEADDLTYVIKKTETSDITETAIASELTKSGSVKLLKRAEGEDAGSYAISLNSEAAVANFDVKTTEGVTYEIVPLPVKITALDASRYFFDKSPAFDYTVELGNIEDDAVKADILKNAGDLKSKYASAADDKEVIICEEDNVHTYVGKYDLQMSETAATARANFSESFDKETSGKLEVKVLPITVSPKKDYHKKYGDEDPEIKFDITVDLDESELNNTPESIAKMIKTDDSILFEREEGESVGTYEYEVTNEEDLINYEITVFAEKDFEIEELEIKEIKDIDSRTSSFTIESNMMADSDQDVFVNIAFDNVPGGKSANGVSFKFDESDYEKVSLKPEEAKDGTSMKVVLDEVDYSKEKQTWKGYLPAGTKVSVTLVDEDGAEVSNSVDFNVTKKAVTISEMTAPGTHGDVKFTVPGEARQAVTAQIGGMGDGEYIVVTNSVGGTKYEKVTDGSYSYTPDIHDTESTHVDQVLNINVLDTLNLQANQVAALTVKADDKAFDISNITYSNRADKVTMLLPEYGEGIKVSIGGRELTAKENSEQGELTMDVALPINNLPKEGDTVEVTYTDMAGHTGKGTGTIAKSTVNTPLTIKIRPELNVNGFLNGQSKTLLISGTGVAGERIAVTVAGERIETVINSAGGNWNDAAGTWEISYDMSRLPEGENFTISVEYLDVNGQSAELTVKYDSFVASASVNSPVYEAMTYISGMVEPNTSVALYVNGDEQNYYEIEVDRFGHFVMDQVPMLFAGDTFTIFVQDIAGNTNIREYKIEDPQDPFTVDGEIHTLGTFIYSAQPTGSVTYSATPINLNDFENDTVEIPLLFGLSYQAGTITLKKTNGGFTAATEVALGDYVSENDYTLGEGKLYVYTERPSLNTLNAKTGRVYADGETIALAANETVWLVYDRDLTILADDIADMTAYSFVENGIYDKFYEHNQQYQEDMAVFAGRNANVGIAAVDRNRSLASAERKDEADQ